MKINGGHRICEHKFDLTNLKLLKCVNNPHKLDAYESVYLFKNRKRQLMNDELQKFENIQSPYRCDSVDRSSHRQFFQ
jgi:hypothetical protein